MTARFFADTNVAIYTLDTDPTKRARARAIMRRQPVVSSQVINEFIAVLLSKARLPRLMRRCEVVPVTAETVRTALELGERYQLSHWGALIVAAALLSGCDTLYTEDLQRGKVLEGRLTVVNPFL
jgi:predicted nucleic acid-binding protein